MSILHTITVFVATLFLALTGRFMATGTAAGDCDWNLMPCETG